MPNPLLYASPDKPLAAALRKALKDGTIYRGELFDIVQATADKGGVSDVQYRDLLRFIRKRTMFHSHNKKTLLSWLAVAYPLQPIGLYPHGDIWRLDRTRKRGNQHCAALVQHNQPAGAANTWRKGPRVRGNTAIRAGTPIATFEDGIYPNRDRDNHVAYYLEQDPKLGVRVMDQWVKVAKVGTRWMDWKGKLGNGLYREPSNNGDALSVIMRKKPK